MILRVSADGRSDYNLSNSSFFSLYMFRILSIYCSLFSGEISEKMARENNFLNIVGMVRFLLTQL